MQINTQRIKIIGAGALEGVGMVYAVISLTNTLIEKLVPDNDASDIGQETLNNSTIEHEHVGAGLIYGITSVVKTLINKLVPDNDGSDIGQETLNNSTIEHEERSHRSATFLFDFENGNENNKSFTINTT